MQFPEFPLNKNLLQSIEKAGFTNCTEVQAETFPITLDGKDVMVQSQTGTGKTAAFLISLLEHMERSKEKERALILVPTRELAVQIEREAEILALYQQISAISITGGVGYQRQEDALAAGVEIVIGTPGRLIDFANKGTLRLKEFSYIVIDEADRMFDMGFIKDIRKILRQTAKSSARQTMLFSATLDYAVKSLAREFMNNPEEVRILSKNITVQSVSQHLYHVGSKYKMKLLLWTLKQHNTVSALIFTNMKHRCEEVAGRLNINGYQAEFLTGDLPQRTRQNRVERFKQHELPILVATDVAARGLHIEDLGLVINYDVPQYFENYVHRIGRTARVGKSGVALTFACEEDAEYLAPIEHFIEMQIPYTIADEEMYEDDKSKNRGMRGKRPARSEGDKRSGRRKTAATASDRRQSERTVSGRRRTDTSKKESKPATHKKKADKPAEPKSVNLSRTRGRKKNRVEKLEELPVKEARKRPAAEKQVKPQRKKARKAGPPQAKGRIAKTKTGPAPMPGSLKARKKPPTVQPRKKGILSKVISIFK